MEGPVSEQSLRAALKRRLKKALPNVYALLVTVRKSSQLFSDLRKHDVNSELLRDVIRKAPGTARKTCPLCGFHGYFEAFGSPPRWDARCPSCGSLERHRLLALALRDTPLRGSLLHFAPEPWMADALKRHDVRYTSADLVGPDVDLNLNIENIACPDAAYDVVLCSHVLEHVDDSKALKELHRILRPGGLLIAMVPIVEGCAKTYEDDTVARACDREAHFHQHDHVRVYGADFRQRLTAAGFEVRDYTAFGREAVNFGLNMGEKAFFCRRLP